MEGEEEEEAVEDEEEERAKERKSYKKTKERKEKRRKKEKGKSYSQAKAVFKMEQRKRRQLCTHSIKPVRRDNDLSLALGLTEFLVQVVCSPLQSKPVWIIHAHIVSCVCNCCSGIQQRVG